MYRKGDTMNKKILTVVGVLALSLCVGVYSLFNRMFPKANIPDFGYPSAYEISYHARGDALSWERITLESEIDGDSYTMPTMLDTLNFFSNATPTREMSGNDHPDVSPYFQIDMDCTGFSDTRVRFYVYARGEQVYFEIPYGGIYKTDPRVLTFLERNLEEWLAYCLTLTEEGEEGEEMDGE